MTASNYFGRSWQERFWEKVTRGADCWEWQGARTHNGYGTFSIRSGTSQRAHRVAYELLVGPILEGLQLDHLCRNRTCVNPDHLEPVTPRENLMRGETPAAINSAKTHCKHGHEFTPENTYVNHGHRACKTCTRINNQRRRRRLAKAREVAGANGMELPQKFADIEAASDDFKILVGKAVKV